MPKTPETVSDYLDEARKNLSVTSDRALGNLLGVSRAALAAYRSEKAFPGDTTMLRVAQLANRPAAEALIVLHTRKAKDPDVREVFASLKKKCALGLLSAALVFPTLLPSSRAQAAVIACDHADCATGRRIRRRIIAAVRRFLNGVRPVPSVGGLC